MTVFRRDCATTPNETSRILGRSRLVILIGLVLVAGVGGYLYQRSAWPIVNAHPKPGGAIVAFGDSLTAGMGAPGGKSYPDQLSDMIQRPVITAASAARPWPKPISGWKKSSPSNLRLSSFCWAAMDLLRRANLNESFTTLEKMIRGFQSQGALVIVVGLSDLSAGGAGFRNAIRPWPKPPARSMCRKF